MFWKTIALTCRSIGLADLAMAVNERLEETAGIGQTGTQGPSALGIRQQMANLYERDSVGTSLAESQRAPDYLELPRQ